ncbi:dephospho-CoA kinase [Neisseria sp. Dent CA1/247]|uniref:dephospho-CoA kinase n=1 Tax=Neisseria sp. Dent CA1/247 TaxID=2912675 RepID=UPI001FD5C30C|nr:dephospho-CoA kinase [Neisseria sp. Dent CA1/247]UOO76448.1 dephospho-CoA kinase [Neisseria sp. Dent CA1/247]
MAFWVGLTGGIGSGKSQAAAEFLHLGVPVIDADEISRKITGDNGRALPEIRRVFGAALFDHEGRLKRDILRDLVFRRPEAKSQLESLMHPLILEEIHDQQRHHQHSIYGIIDIPLLIEKPIFSVLANRILVVDVTEECQIKRVQQRSGLDPAEIKRIMATQATRQERLLAADDVLSNEGTIQELACKVRCLHRFYQARFSYLSRVTL